jgi:putative DNA primase/helicase
MIDGCIAWQAAGLNPPERVRVATQDYLESADAFGRWLEERCIRAPNETATKGEVFASWKAWAEANGEFVGSQRRLNDKLAAVPGLDEGRLGHGGRKAWLGLGLLSEA